jgi:hypothetical protein
MLEKDPIKVEFYTSIKGLADTPDLHPRATKSFTPDWFKQIPSQKSLNNSESVFNETKTVKICPSFPDYFSQGYVIPMWADTTLKYQTDIDTWEYRCGQLGDSPYKIEVHGHPQYLDYAPSSNFLGKKSDFMFKFISPWELKTPEGYSVLQLPMFYHFDDNFSVLPGIIDTDIHHTINQQVTYHGDGSEIFIKKGTPLVQYIPFKRDQYELVVKEMDQEYLKIREKMLLNLHSSFEGGYRDLQRKRDM